MSPSHGKVKKASDERSTVPNYETLLEEIEWMRPKIERIMAQEEEKRELERKEKLKARPKKSIFDGNKENRRPNLAMKAPRTKTDERVAQLMLSFGTPRGKVSKK
jgi:hypothetical protein